MHDQQLSNLSPAARESLEKLNHFFMMQKTVMIAFSGGMDSSFMSLIAHRHIPGSYRSVFVNSPFMSAEETRIARATASRYSLLFEETDVNPLTAPEVVENNPQRCYHCKKFVFQHLLNLMKPGEILCEGSVTDDYDDYRPGKVAIKELKVYSPLQASGFSKALIAEVLQALDASELIRPGQSCLATRIATGSAITSDKLLQIARGEELLRNAGLGFCRLRHHGNLARIEARPGDRHKALDAGAMLKSQFAELGFKHICVDIAGYQRGSMNE